MARITDIDEGTIRRVDWQEVVPPTLFLRSFSATFKFGFIALFAILLALLSDSSFPIRVWDHTYCKVAALDVLSNCSLAEDPLFPLRLIVLFVVGIFLTLAVSRTSVVRLTTTSRSSTLASLAFAFRRAPSLLIPFLAPCASALLCWGMILLARMTGGVAGVLLPVGLIFLGVFWFATVITAIAFPLAVSAIAAENCDGFDALSRGVSYATQRPLILIIYLAISALIACIGFVLTSCFVAGIVKILVCALPMFPNAWVAFWMRALAATPFAYLIVSSVVCVNTIYILLRRSVDGTPYDVCALNLKGNRVRQLRKILEDDKGAPEFDFASAKAESAQTAEPASGEDAGA